MRPLFALLGIVFFFSCTIDSEVIPVPDENLNLQSNSPQRFLPGIYKGVFTTIDSKYRATVHIELPKANAFAQSTEKVFPEASIKLHTGEVIVAKASHIAYEGTLISDLLFESEALSFVFSVAADGSDPEVTQVVFNNIPAFVIVAKHTALAPVTPISGTYSCINCNGHPNLDTGLTQTFNMIFSENGGEGSMTTQTMLGTTMFTGIGYQNNCSSGSSQTNCAINSGDGSTTTIGYYSNGNPVYWSGTHLLSNGGPSTEPECAEVSGTWEWQSISYGVLTGAFTSDSGC